MGASEGGYDLEFYGEIPRAGAERLHADLNLTTDSSYARQLRIKLDRELGIMHPRDPATSLTLTGHDLAALRDHEDLTRIPPEYYGVLTFLSIHRRPSSGV
jgi:hypothetical protein